MMSFRTRRNAAAARSAGAALALCAAVALGVSGCGGSGDSGGGAETTSTPATAAGGQSTEPGAGAADSSGLTGDQQKAITSAYETFFSGQSDAQTKLGVIEDPDRFAKTINAQASSGLAESTSVQVSRMDLVGPGRAAVTYTILMDDKPVLPDQTGYAIETDGEWKVSASSFCGLLTLENGGTPPAECAGQGGGPAAPAAPATPTS